MTIRINSLLANSLIIRLPEKDLEGVDIYILDKNLNLEIFFVEEEEQEEQRIRRRFFKTFRILRRNEYNLYGTRLIPIDYDYKDLVPYRRIVDYHNTDGVSKIFPGFSFKEYWTRLIINESGFFSQIEKKFY